MRNTRWLHGVSGRSDHVVWIIRLSIVVSTLSIILGVLTNIVSGHVPRTVQRWAVPAFFAVVILFLVGVAWQARLSLPILGRKSKVRRQAEKRQMVLAVMTAVQQALNETFVDIPRLPLKINACLDLLRSSRLLPDTPVSLPKATEHAENINLIFGNFGKSLLIVGDGGSGKSTLLAELCLRLCQDLKQDKNPEIPVLLNLATWHDDDRTLEDWLRHAVADTYPWVGQEVVSEWVDDRALILILDGLDEVLTAGARRQVLRAIEAFIRSGPCPIVIGCRTDEYGRSGTKLSLAYAVELQTPIRQEVVDYLTNLRSPVADAVKAVPYADQNWWSMMSTPLMLGCIARVSSANPNAAVISRGSAKQRRRHIIEVYVDTLLRRRPDRPPNFKPDDARRWLEWLAVWMSRHTRSEFYIDSLAPDLIADITDVTALKRRPRYWLSLTWVGAIGVLEILSLVGWGDISAWYPLFLNGSIVTFFTSIHIRSHYCSSKEPIRLVWRVSGRWLAYIALGLVSTSIGVILGRPTSSGSSAEKVVLWTLSAFLVTTPAMIAVISNPESISDHAGLPPGVRIRRSRRAAWMAALLLGLPIALASGVIRGINNNDMAWGLSFAASFAVICMTSCWLMFGGVSDLQYRALFRSLARADYGPTDYLSFLEWSADRRLLQPTGSAFRFPHREIQQHLHESWHQKHPPRARHKRPAPSISGKWPDLN